MAGLEKKVGGPLMAVQRQSAHQIDGQKAAAGFLLLQTSLSPVRKIEPLPSPTKNGSGCSRLTPFTPEQPLMARDHRYLLGSQQCDALPLMVRIYPLQDG